MMGRRCIEFERMEGQDSVCAHYVHETAGLSIILAAGNGQALVFTCGFCVADLPMQVMRCNVESFKSVRVKLINYYY